MKKLTWNHSRHARPVPYDAYPSPSRAGREYFYGDEFEVYGMIHRSDAGNFRAETWLGYAEFERLRDAKAFCEHHGRRR